MLNQNSAEEHLQMHDITKNLLIDKDMLERREFGFINNIGQKYQKQYKGHFYVHSKHVFYDERSLFLLSDKNILRKGLVWLIKWRWFTGLTTLIIILNSVNLSIYDYSDRDSLTSFNKVLNILNDISTFIFLAESIIKIFAMGFIMHENSYLRDGWNILDFFIVIIGIIELIAYDINLKALRILRVIRPLRSIRASPSMRRQVTTLLQSLPEIGNSTIFISFMTILFAILGLQQFTGVVYYRCRLTPKPVNATYWPKSEIHTRICSPGGDGDFECPAGLFCGSPIQYGISLENDGIYDDPYIQYGINSYDNIFKAFVGVFQVLTVQDWTPLMYNLADGYSQVFAKAYFCVILIFGHYYMLQLLLAVIIANLSKIQAQQAFEDITHHRRLVEIDGKTKHQDLDMNQIEKNGGFEFEEGEKKPEEKKQDNGAMSEMAKALKAARAAKLEAQKKAEEEAKQKEADAGKSTMQQMAAAIKKAKEEKAKKDAEEKAKKEAEEKAQREAEERSKNLSEILIIQPEEAAKIEAEKEQARQAAREKEMDEKVKKTLMWSVNGESGAKEDMTSGIGLALLSRALGVQKMEDKFQRHMNNIKKTKMVSKLELRLKLQKKILDDVGRLTRKTDLDVSKMYWKSRKNVYGIDNEIHLVEQVQSCMKIIFNDQILSRQKITHEDIDKIFEFEKKDQLFVDSDQAWLIHQKPQLDLHMYLALKISLNLKELTYQQNVKNFFFTRFKRRLIKKSIIDNIELKTQKYIIQTGILIRARNSCLYTAFNKFTNSKIFKTTTVLAIIANGIVLSLSSERNQKELDKITEYLNVGFFGFFMMELVSKLIGQGFRHYMRDKFNWFDGLVVIVSAVDVTLLYTLFTNQESSSSGAITALRVFRLIRIFQLAHLWKDFQELLTVVLNTLKEVSNISVLILIFVFSYTLIGMELFAFKLPAEKDVGFYDSLKRRSTFNTFIESFFSVFIVLVGDGWTQIYFDHYRHIDILTSSLFFMSLIIVGQFILMNLFISVLIENFEQLSVRNDLVLKLTDIESKGLGEKIIDNLKAICSKNKVTDSKTKKRSKMEQMMDEKYQEELKQQDVKRIESPSLFIFKYKSYLRQMCIYVSEHPYYEWAMTAIILFSSFTLAIDNPLNDPSTIMSEAFLNIDYVFSGIFVIEVAMKVIGYGFIMSGSKSYMRSYWNLLDFLVVSITITSYFTSSDNLSAIKVFKLIKVLRPLRAISKNPGLKISISALAIALPGIFDILIVMLLFFFIFGIITMNYFKGNSNYCDSVGLESTKMSSLFNLAVSKWDCLNSGALWRNKFMNFDSTPNSMATLFIISNSVQWRETFYTAVYARESDLIASKAMQSIPSGLFFIFIIIVGNFFLLNLFTGIVISKYNRERELNGKNFLLTEEQKKWVKNRLNILQAQPKYRMKMPDNEYKQPFFFIAESQYVQIFIMLCIVINTVILTLQWYGQSQEVNQAFENLNYIFAFIFTCEFIVKYVGYGQRLFYDAWNTFDLVIVIVTIIGMIMGQYSSYSFGPQTTIIRSFRIVRVFYFFKKNKALRGTLMTFMVSLPAMANLVNLLLLIIFIYSIMGMYLFAEVKKNGALNDQANFQTIGSAFINLVGIMTGENWPLMMEALSRKKDVDYECIDAPSYEDFVKNQNDPVGCGNQGLAILYFFSYTLFVAIIYMRLFIAIILQTFHETTERDNKFMNTELSDRFREVWSRFDSNATSFVRAHSYTKFLLQLGEPLGWDSSYEHNFLKQQDYIKEIFLPKYNTGTEYYFMDVFEQLILIMIIRREVINFAIKTKHLELLGALEDFNFDHIDDQYNMTAPLLGPPSSRGIIQPKKKNEAQDLKYQEKRTNNGPHSGQNGDGIIGSPEDLKQKADSDSDSDQDSDSESNQKQSRKQTPMKPDSKKMYDSKEIKEMSLIRFESHDFVKNNNSEQLNQENLRLPPVNVQDQNMGNIQPEDAEQDKATNHDGGVTARETQADLKNDQLSQQAYSSQSKRRVSSILGKKKSLRNFQFGLNMDFKPARKFDGDNTYVDILKDPADLPMEKYSEDKLIEQEYRAMENERIIAQITEKANYRGVSSEEEDELDADSQFDNDMRIIEEEMETLETKKDQGLEHQDEEPDIELGNQAVALGPKSRSKANPVLIVNPNVKDNAYSKRSSKVALLQKEKEPMDSIISIIETPSNKYSIPIKPAVALGKRKSSKHKD